MRQDGRPTAGGGNDRPGNLDRRRNGPRKQKAFVERATARGHSGYGSESVRPHLRDQLKLKELLQPGLLVIMPEPRGKDEHHQ
ncbi:hypothetical protein FN976_19695 [Caenimonas sedimenti]|uniref:Uncharacterized protein n=1 Tax=Caenimonas sedimenti TaxID=2596921 RepID=A0A562ZM90_9BURK|nr:hypothetical protein [Caenimonas sedimenti]TWO69511.1 hypothetical protein FN976_19695 [Caenimonas sedimenti]